MNEYLGKTILFTLGDNDALRQSMVQDISPNGLYVYLSSDRTKDEHIGWQPISQITIKDVLTA